MGSLAVENHWSLFEETQKNRKKTVGEGGIRTSECSQPRGKARSEHRGRVVLETGSEESALVLGTKTQLVVGTLGRSAFPVPLFSHL